jgi:small-conductance mechanosensitive channel
MFSLTRALLRRSIGLGAVIACLSVISVVPELSAQDQPPATSPTDTQEKVTIATAPVTLGGEELFEVRGTSAFPAERRAKETSSRIKALADDPEFDPETLDVVETEISSDIVVGNQVVMRVADADARLEQLERRLLAELKIIRIREAIEDYRIERSFQVLVWRAVMAGIATAVLALVVAVVLWLGRRFSRYVDKRYAQRIKSIKVQSFSLLEAEVILKVLHRAFVVLSVLIFIILGYSYLHFVLDLFPWTRPISDRLIAYLLEPLGGLLRAFILDIPNLILIVLLILLTRYVLRALRLFFVALDQKRIAFSGFESEWALPTYKIVRVFIIAMMVVIAYPYIPGSESAGFQGVSIFLGVILTLGSTSVISNIIAGHTMTYRRAFRLGDRIRVEDTTGIVVDIRLLVTHLRTSKNETVAVPNTVILASPVTNYSALARDGGLILHTVVGIGYDTPWRQVEAMLLLAAERTAGLLKAPAPFVLQKGLGDHCIDYELNAYCDDPLAIERLYSAMHGNILDVFNENGVQIMSPSYVADPAEPKLVTKEDWYAPPAAKPGEAGADG